MTDFGEFEHVFRDEAQKRKDNGEDAPSWSDVKRLVKERRLYDEEDMRDPEFKAQLKERATELALAILSAEPEKTSPNPSKKRKADSKQLTAKERPAKRAKPTTPKSTKKEVASEEDSGSEMEAVRRSKVTSQKKSKKSKQTTEDSEEEPEEKPARKRAKLKQREESSAAESDFSAVIPPKSPEVDRSPRVEEKRILAADVAELSDSALSVVIDGSPAKPKKSKKEGKKAEPKGTKERKKDKSPKGKVKGDATGDPDEVEIKRLKGFVVACGVRKKWAKEFEGVEDKPKKQIARLKGILQELGMTGRLSMEKAKAIRTKRELAEEIEEVVQFEARRGLPKDQDRGKSKRKKQESPEEEPSEDEEKLASNPPTRKKNVLAFLDDQSDEE